LPSLDQLHFTNSFAALPEDFYSKVLPQGVSDPYIIATSKSCANLLELNDIESDQFLAVMSGNKTLSQMEPLAALYSGHQFGVYNPQLGDGRALLLGDIITSQGNHFDIQLKGAGSTPYSRTGDGRAVLRSSIREFLCSEAMAGLGIPTTRALSLIGSDIPIYREEVETAAIVSRVAPSHVRFGSFEIFHHTRREKQVKQLANHVISNHLPDLQTLENPYAGLLQYTVTTTAKMIAQWQTVGFCHGVMNTDNMSILGLTIDYGPFAFLDNYQPTFICNHSDPTGRYAFNQQPGIGLWNLNALAQALSSLVSKDEIIASLALYEPELVTTFSSIMRSKLGLTSEQENDQELISGLFDLMTSNQSDYTNTFRSLANFSQHGNNQLLRDNFTDRQAFDTWGRQYSARLAVENSTDDIRSKKMNKVNPKFILRSYLAQNAIDAAKQKDFSEVQNLLAVLSAPFDEHVEFESYASGPPDWGKALEISCSS
jgi:uncharacterized protein YdiU (UPF0061 family)